MTKIPYIPLYIDDYEAATVHLTAEEDGIYFRLIRLCWRTPGCSIPNDPKWITRRMRVPLSDFDAKIKPVIDEFFTIKRNRILQKRLQSEFGKAKSNFEARSNAGKMGGRPKSLKNNEKDKSNALTKLKLSESNQNQNQNHIKNTKKRKSNLSEDWQPSTKLIASIAEKEHTTQEWVKGQIEPFKNYWLGEGGTKIDWDRTFRNRCNNDYNNKPKSNGHANGQSTFWHHPLQNFALYGQWHVESCGEHEPTIDGVYNPLCKAPRELIEQIVIKSSSGQ